MTDPQPRLPWWKRRRWAAALLLWLVAIPFLYALSMGPAVYALRRDWISDDTYDSYGRFMFPLVRHVPEHLGLWYGRYTGWWLRLADGE